MILFFIFFKEFFVIGNRIFVGKVGEEVCRKGFFEEVIVFLIYFGLGG